MIGWVDAAAGASGDMLLAAILDAGVEENLVRSAVQAVSPEPVTIHSETVMRRGLRSRRAYVDVSDSATHRGLSDVVRLIESADLDPAIIRHAVAVFTRLGETEADVHGVGVDEVHFHEVGALDAIADIVGVCAGMVALDIETLLCSPVAVGSGTVETAHGRLSVPPPAVAALLQGVPTYGGPAQAETCTPTGAALLRHWVTDWGPQPPMRVTRVGHGSGARDFTTHPNVLRLFLGEAASTRAAAAGTTSESAAVVVQTNVDDLDPRLWPTVLDHLLATGASDAWLTPIVMKKGRPAHTLSVLTEPTHVAAVRRVIFTETSALGLREYEVSKQELSRTFTTVNVDGEPIAVKLGYLGGAVVNVQPEYDDVARAADVLHRPQHVVLGQAIGIAHELLSSRDSEPANPAG